MRQLASGAIGEASRLLGRASVDDPFIGHLLPHARRRRLAFPPFFRSVIDQQVGMGTVWVCSWVGAPVDETWLVAPGCQPSQVLAVAVDDREAVRLALFESEHDLGSVG